MIVTLKKRLKYKVSDTKTYSANKNYSSYISLLLPK